MNLLSLRRLAVSACLSSISLLGLVATAQANAQPFSALYVFGDSLSDGGNNAVVLGANAGQVITSNAYIPVQPYGSNTYSNGPVWVSSFAAGLGLAASSGPSLGGGGNYAYGGARVAVDGSFFGFPPSLNTQVNSYLGSAPLALSSTALYVIAGGGNDVRAVGEAASANPANAVSIITAGAQSFASSIGGMIDALQARGAVNIVVWDAPNVGRAPAVSSQGASVAGAATVISNAFNSALDQRLASEPGVQLFSIFDLIGGVTTSPTGFTNISDACGALGAACDPSKYLFWDGLHPTSAGQQVIASAMLAAVGVVPEPASMLLLGFGVLTLLVVSARQRRA